MQPGPLAGGGFSPGPAGPCMLPGGRRVFVKACGPELNPSTPDVIRREALVDRLDPWSRRHLDALVALEADWPDATTGDAFVHGDERTDNVVLTSDGGVVVDWPSAGVGPPWLDLVGMLPSFHLDGAPPPADVFAAHPVGRAAPPDRVDCFVAALCGYFTRQSLLPPPPGLPTVRSFQAAQGVVMRAWLADRTSLS